MIIWINGAYGVGKTHTAYELQRRLTDAVVFDPEIIGFYLKQHLPSHKTFESVQQLPFWRQQVEDILIYCNQNATITIVPMTIIHDDIFIFLIEGLKQKGIDVQHYTLMADKATIEKRLASRGDKNAWNYKQVEKCLDCLRNDLYVKQIDTTTNNVDFIVEWIANDAALTLTKGRLTPIRNKLRWLKIYLQERIILSLISFLKI